MCEIYFTLFALVLQTFVLMTKFGFHRMKYVQYVLIDLGNTDQDLMYLESNHKLCWIVNRTKRQHIEGFGS